MLFTFVGMNDKITRTGAIFIVIAIILGAMAAHMLEKHISSALVETFEKGVKYQMYIGLSFLIVGLNSKQLKFKLNLFYLFNLIGVILFSGCIYLYALHEIVPGFRPAAMVVPFGGTALIVGWIIFIIQLLKNKSD